MPSHQSRKTHVTPPYPRPAGTSKRPPPEPPTQAAGAALATGRTMLITAKSAVLTAGAIAVAISAIWALVPHRGPLRVQFDSVALSATPISINQFVPIDSPLAPRSAGSIGLSRLQPVRMDIGTTQIPTPVASTAAPAASAQSELGTDQPPVSIAGPEGTPPTGTTTTSSGSAPSETGAPTGPTTDTTTPGQTGTDSTSSTSSTKTVSTPTTEPTSVGSGPIRLSHQYMEEVSRVASQERLRLDPDRVRSLVTVMVQTLPQDPDPTASTDSSTPSPLTPKQAAKKLATLFVHVRKTPGTHGLTEPLGVVVTAQVSLENAKGIPVDVAWELSGGGSASQSLNSDWVRVFRAYQLLATDDSDRGSFSMWVPIPPEQGDYQITLIARSSSTDAPIATFVSTVIH